MSREFDVLVAGGGPVGATLAALLVRYAGLDPARVGLLEPRAPAPPTVGGEPELRVSAISRAGERILRRADAWERLDATRLCPYERMRVWHAMQRPDSPDVLVFDAAEVGEPDLGAIIENRQLQAAAFAAFTAAGGAHLPGELRGIEVGADAATVGTGSGAVRARLVVGADGARSPLRAALGIAQRRHGYGQQAIVATVATEQPHQCTAWQRFLGSGPLALLPLFDGRCSIVWSASDALADELLRLDPAAFAARLDTASDRALGATRLTSERLAFPLRSLAAQEYVRPRCALAGDAAHVVHPLAGQGMNLGLLDAAALCEAVAGAVASREDPGALRILRHYEQARRTHNLAMDAAMTFFNAAFSQPEGVRGWLAARALARVGASGIARRAFIERALGLAGELPRLARPAA